MTYQEIYDEVVALTKRPELATETRIAIQSVTLNHHARDSYKQDLIEDYVIFPSEQNIQELDVINGLIRFRAFSYVRRYDFSTNQPAGFAGAYFKPQDADHMLDTYGFTESNRYYRAGKNVKFYAQPAFQYLLIGYYSRPLITVENFDSWIAREYPYLIIFDAAMKVCNITGNTEAAKGIQMMKDESSAIVTINETELNLR